MLQTHLRSEELTLYREAFADIYSSDIHKQKQVTDIYVKLMNIRETKINNSPVETTGPCINLLRPSILSDRYLYSSFMGNKLIY